MKCRRFVSHDLFNSALHGTYNRRTGWKIRTPCCQCWLKKFGRQLTRHLVWDLRFSRWCCCRFKSSSLLHCVDC